MAVPLTLAFLLLGQEDEGCMAPEALLQATPESILTPCDQNNLGDLYYYGDGVTKDHEEALKWFRLAADQGYHDAQHNMGEMYFNGQAVTRDYAEAYMWLSLASEDHGRLGKAAEAFRDRLFTLLTPEQIAEADAGAAAWVPVTTP
ncbi:MAG: tetratricopeptide repeat protein [Alphaproteobacteria bacterium]